MNKEFLHIVHMNGLASFQMDSIIIIDFRDNIEEIRVHCTDRKTYTFIFTNYNLAKERILENLNSYES